MNRAERRRAIHEQRRNGQYPQAFKDWLCDQIANPPDEQLRPFLQTAMEEVQEAETRRRKVKP
jgi:hypothetical protein